MPTSLQEEIRQTRPFSSPEQEALLSIVRTASVLMDDADRALKPYGITSTQYNVLRILRGSEPDGLCRNELRDRMLTRMPDVTRLLDRMEEAGLVVRERSTDDRRMVRTRITKKALDVILRVDPVLQAGEENRFRGVSADRIKTLIEVLAVVRSGG